MKVLLGVDDSSCSQLAVEFVRNMSWPADTSVIVAASATLPASAYLASYAGMEFGNWLEQLTAVFQEVVTRDESVLRAAGLHVESRVLRGDPRETLLDTARQQRVDLIVVGSHGRTGLDKLVMGSVASHVVTHAPCSVLVVRPSAR